MDRFDGTRRLTRGAVISFLAWMFVLLGTLRAADIYVPNFSFESQPTQFVDPRIAFWQRNPQPPTFGTNTRGSWDNLAGLFLKPPSANVDHLDNADGNHLVYLFSYPQAGFFQDNNSIDWSGTASHAFNAKFQAGKSYRLTAAI